MLNNRKNLIVSLVSFALIIVIPLLIDWLIIGNNFSSNISNSDWVNFLGGYIGAIIGAVVSLIGIIITIKYTSDQNKKDRELQVRPYCAIRYVNDNKLVGTQKTLGAIPIGCEPSSNNGPRYDSIIYIKNIGLGPAIEFSIMVDEINDGREHYPILMQTTPDTMNNAVSLLQSGEEAAIPVLFCFNFDPIKDEDVIKHDMNNFPTKYSVEYAIMKKYKNFDILITVTYCDMFQNKFSQKIILASNMYVEITKEGKATHKCDIYLKETTIPVQLK